MLVSRRYRLELDSEQSGYAGRVVDTCRAVWNAALEQRRAAAQLNRDRTPERQRWPTFPGQSAELTVAKRTETWLAEAPANCLQQTLRDLDRACLEHTVWGVHFRSRRRSVASFRLSDERQIGKPKRLNRRWGELRLPKLGRVRFRWTRPLGGTIRNATVIKDGEQWHIAFCIDDGICEIKPNGLPPVGIDRGVAIPVATSDGQCFPFAGIHPGEKRRLKRLQQRLCRRTKSSRRRTGTVRAIGRLWGRVRRRRADFAHQTRRRINSRPFMGWSSSRTCGYSR